MRDVRPTATADHHRRTDERRTASGSHDDQAADSFRAVAVAVPIGALRPADTPRFTGLNDEHAAMLAQMDAELPPILVRRTTMRVIDGMHRLRAAQLRGQTTITVQFFDGTEDDAFLRAVESNITHGLPLTLAERRAAAERIVASNPDRSDRSIGIITGLAAKTVASIRRTAGSEAVRLTARVGRDGRVRPVNAADGRRAAGRIFVEHPDASLRAIAQQAGISIGTARDVRERLRRGQDPTLPDRRTRGGESEEPEREVQEAPDPPELTESAETASILADLRRDPSLRYSDTGRWVLRWLATRAISTVDWAEIVDAIPPHSAIVVSRLARRAAGSWTEFANALDQRVHDFA